MAAPRQAVQVRAGVVRGAQQPCLKVLVIMETHLAFEQFDEHVLGDVLGVRHAARAGEGQPNDGSAVPLGRVLHKGFRPQRRAGGLFGANGFRYLRHALHLLTLYTV